MIRESRLWGIIVSAILLVAMASAASAQEQQINLNALLQETQMMSQGSDDLTMVWWIPEEFWQTSFAQDGSVSADQAEEFMRVLRPYTIIVAVDGTFGTFGGVTYKSEDYMRENMTIKDIHGNIHKPLAKAEIDPDAMSLLSTMKPVLENVLGPMGENMHFLLFPAADKNGAAIADPKQEGIMFISLGSHSFRYRLPLGSLLPPKTCPVDGEQMNGAWKYCPWHGVELK